MLAVVLVCSYRSVVVVRWPEGFIEMLIIQRLAFLPSTIDEEEEAGVYTRHVIINSPLNNGYKISNRRRSKIIEGKQVLCSAVPLLWLL